MAIRAYYNSQLTYSHNTMLLYVHIYVLTYMYLCSPAEWRLLGKHFHSLCNTLPHKLKAVPLLSKDGEEQLNKMILSSSATNVGKINQKIITYFIVKLCYSGNSTKLVRLSDVIGELIVSTDTHTSIQQIRSGTYVHMYVYFHNIGIIVLNI